MSGTKVSDIMKDLEPVNIGIEDKETNVFTDVDVKEEGDQIPAESYLKPSPQQEEEIMKKKYGGLLPKKPPLISKDHERAFFDSADWALGKGAGKPKGPLEALRPKLQPTPHQQMRRSAYAPADGHEGDEDHSGEPRDDSTCKKQDEGDDKSILTSGEQQRCPEHLANNIQP